MGEGNSCSCCNKGKSFLIIILLALNTFFLGSIWFSMKSCSHGAGVCPFGGKMMSSDQSKMYCPIPGDMLKKNQPVAPLEINGQGESF